MSGYSPQPPLGTVQFAHLMQTYAESYRQLQLLFEHRYDRCDRLVSTVINQPPLYFEVTERHAYTTCARMTYFIEQRDGTISPDPDAHVRIYHDAEIAEATHCYPGTVNQPLFGALVPVSDVVEHRWRTNRFFDRWLEYLLRQGHGLGTLRAAKAQEWPRPAPSIAGQLHRLGNQDLAER